MPAIILWKILYNVSWQPNVSKLKYQNFNFATRKCFFPLYRTRDKQTVWQIKSNQIKSNQIKSNQIKSNQIKSNQIRSGQVRSGQVRFASPDVAHLRRKLFWTMETFGTNAKRKMISGRKIKVVHQTAQQRGPPLRPSSNAASSKQRTWWSSVRVHQGRPTLRLPLESQLDIPGAELHEGNVNMRIWIEPINSWRAKISWPGKGAC